MAKPKARVIEVSNAIVTHACNMSLVTRGRGAPFLLITTATPDEPRTSYVMQDHAILRQLAMDILSELPPLKVKKPRAPRKTVVKH